MQKVVDLVIIRRNLVKGTLNYYELEVLVVLPVI